ncbi:hypothetical protein EDB85DRAFT_847858 [Lactarius pseudohatsudake]|nr:hypothetical protein EDB85DRAFT_847858 [Lactarius pseudohatsudake]
MPNVIALCLLAYSLCQWYMCKSDAIVTRSVGLRCPAVVSYPMDRLGIHQEKWRSGVRVPTCRYSSSFQPLTLTKKLIAPSQKRCKYAQEGNCAAASQMHLRKLVPDNSQLHPGVDGGGPSRPPDVKKFSCACSLRHKQVTS